MRPTLRPQAFYFMRHGQTDWNKTGRIMGSLDIELNDVGREQAHDAAKMLKGKGIDVICHSPKKRAAETAKIVAETIGAKLVCVDALAEVCLGEFEGGPKVMGLWNRFMGGETPQKAESYQDFCHRTVSAVDKALEKGENVLVVAHGGSYVALKDFTGFLGTPKANNCDIFHFVPQDDAWDITPIAA